LFGGRCSGKKTVKAALLFPLLALAGGAFCSCSTVNLTGASAGLRLDGSVAVHAENSQDSLIKARDRALAERARALDFESDSYFPGEWQAAEAGYVAARGLQHNTAAGVRQAAGEYSASADAFRGLFIRALPLFFQARNNEIGTARDGALAAGLDQTFPGCLPLADQTALAAMGQFEAGDYYAARDSAAQALAKYQVLRIAADAWLLRREILDRGFTSYGIEHFDIAGETLTLAVAAYLAGDVAAAHSGAEEALLRFALALRSGWAEYSVHLGSRARVERQTALDSKAHIAVKEIFDKSETVFRQAADSFAGEYYEFAARRYIEAARMFAEASTLAGEKQRKAAAPVREAGDKPDENGKAIHQAEQIFPPD
jgi:hypothetical protein